MEFGDGSRRCWAWAVRVAEVVLALGATELLYAGTITGKKQDHSSLNFIGIKVATSLEGLDASFSTLALQGRQVCR